MARNALQSNFVSALWWRAYLFALYNEMLTTEFALHFFFYGFAALRSSVLPRILLSSLTNPGPIQTVHCTISFPHIVFDFFVLHSEPSTRCATAETAADDIVVRELLFMHIPCNVATTKKKKNYEETSHFIRLGCSCTNTFDCMCRVVAAIHHTRASNIQKYLQK